MLGFRFGSFAYLTDCNRIPDESYALLRAHNAALVIGARISRLVYDEMEKPAGR